MPPRTPRQRPNRRSTTEHETIETNYNYNDSNDGGDERNSDTEDEKNIQIQLYTEEVVTEHADTFLEVELVELAEKDESYTSTDNHNQNTIRKDNKSKPKRVKPLQKITRNRIDDSWITPDGRPYRELSRAEKHAIAVAKYTKKNPEVHRRAVARYAAKHPEVHRRAVARYAAKNPEVNRKTTAKHSAKNRQVNQRAVARYAAKHPDINRRAVARYADNRTTKSCTGVVSAKSCISSDNEGRTSSVFEGRNNKDGFLEVNTHNECV